MVEISKTERGFTVGNFKDKYGAVCSIQESSSAEPAIWLGVNYADPKIMASVAKTVNPETGDMTGWVKYPIPNDVLLTTRMHLSREQVAELIPLLQQFVDTGRLT